MKFRIFKLFKHIFLFLIISTILFNILVSITNVNADSDSTYETIYYEGYWKEYWNENDNKTDKEKSYAELHQLTRIPSQSNDAPSITVFVHGYGGNASHWSNDSKGNFAYDPTSLIEQLKEVDVDANMYFAKYTSSIMDNLVIEKCDIIDNQYVKSKISKIDDVTKHTIIVFESANETDLHRNVYKELHQIVDLVSYDILYLTGKIPKVNFISHSRGGLISMMYASGYREEGKINKVEYAIHNEEGYIDVGDHLYEIPYDYDDESEIIYDHPYNVANLYSMGTPYNGTNMVNFASDEMRNLFPEMFKYSGSKNVLDEVIQNEIKECWEEAVTKNPALTLHAISGTFNLSFIIGFLYENYSDLDNLKDTQALKLALNLLEYFGAVVEEVLIACGHNLGSDVIKTVAIASIIPFVPINVVIPISLTLNAVEDVEDTLNNAIISINTFKEAYAVILSGNGEPSLSFFNELSFVIEKYLNLAVKFENLLTLSDEIIDTISNKEDYINCSENLNIFKRFGDIIVDRKSQNAKGFSNVVKFEKLYTYTNIHFEIDSSLNRVISYDCRTFDYKKAENTIAVPHNLETLDVDIINYICSNIEIGIPSSIYKFEELSDNTLSIIDFEFPTYYSESYYKFLDTAIKNKNISCIGESAFANLSELKSFTIPETVVNIESKAFENCINLESVTISKNVSEIGGEAFKGCKKLSFVDVKKDCFDVPLLGENVFENCATNLMIQVPANKYIDYCNGSNWKNYESKISMDGPLDNLIIHCETISDMSLELNCGYNKLYMLSVECSKSYKFSTDSNILFKIYDINKNCLISNNRFLTRFLSQGEYYLDVRYLTNDLEGTADIHCELTYSNSTTYVSTDLVNDISSTLHMKTGNKKHTVLKFVNQDPGFYKFKLTAGNITSYPSGAIKVYKDQSRTELLDRFETDMISYSASSNTNENEIYVYLPCNGTYYIDISLNSINYSSVTMEIEEVEVNELDYSSTLAAPTFNVLFENINKYSYFEKIIVDALSKIQIDVIASGTLNDYVPILLFKEEIDYDTTINNREYYLDTIFIGEVNPIEYIPCYTFILEPGTYYIGYIDNTDKVFMNIALTRLVEYSDNMDSILVADPYYTGYDLGTEVLFNYGECNTYTITEGFTRNIYLMVEDRLRDPMSRLEYEWYSSNESVATVSSYGTVLARQVEIDTTVTIFAVLKEDPSIVYFKEFTILNDEEEELIEIELDMSYSYSAENGTYQLELTNTNCPYPMIQYYDWNIVNENEETVSINYWGQVTATNPCECLIIGTYKLNPRVKIIINLSII